MIRRVLGGGPLPPIYPINYGALMLFQTVRMIDSVRDGLEKMDILNCR